MARRRTYQQYCAAARALDIVGERWTMLLVRELLFGPKRYSDLLDGLAGIGPNVLAGRLRHLQASGVVTRRRLPPPAASMVYELTPLGEDLRPVVHELLRWGLNVMGPPTANDHLRPGWLLGLVEATFRPEAARGVTETYEFQVDDEVFHVRVEDGTAEVRQGHAQLAAFTFSSDLATFLAVGAGRLQGADAVASGRARFSGHPEAARRAIEILGPRLEEPGSPGGLFGAMRMRYFRPDAARGVRETYEYRVEEDTFHVVIEDETMDIRPGPAPDPVLVLTMDFETFFAIGMGELDPREAEAEGRASCEGAPEAFQRWLAIAGLGETAEPVAIS